VSWSNTLSSQSFFINGEEYIVQIAGFVNQCPGGTPVSDFITQEKKKNEAYLVGRVLLKRPAIGVVKTASLDGTCPGTDPVTAGIGATVTYCYQVQNTGDVKLTDVSLTDDKYGTITLDKTTLEPGETAEGTSTHTVTPSDYPLLKNIATATGKTPIGFTISAVDDCVVNVVCTPLTVSVSPTSGELNCSVESVDLTATVTGGKGPYSYQWYKGDSPINGATVSSYTATEAGIYKVEVTDANGCTGTSNEVTVTSVGSPSVGVEPTSGELNCNVNEVELTAAVTGGEEPYSYQWYKDDSPITEATYSSYTATGAGIYKVEVTDNNGCTAESNEVEVTSVGSPSVSVSPASGELNCNVNSIELTATVTGGEEPYSYQWYKDDSPITEATDSSYTTTEAGSYKVVVTDANGCTGTSNEVTVTSVGSPSVGVEPTSGELNCNVNEVELTAAVTGGESPYSYQWYKGDSLINGATGSSYTATEAGSYKVVVTDNNGCTGTSNEVVVTSVDSPSVTVSPTSGELNCNVNSIELTATVTGGESPYSYQWYKGDSLINGATGSSYTATEAGSYKVVVTDNNGCTAESSATITAVECVTKIMVDKVTDPSGSTESFEFTGSWRGGVTFALTDGATPHDSGQLEPGTYTVTENLPAGWDLSSITIEGDTDGGSSTSGSTATIDLDAGETITVTFTNALHTGGLGKLDVSGYKFNDLNADGSWDDGEPGIEGWTIYLSDGTTTISTTTGADGSYSFTNLPAGTYKITEETRDGWTRTTTQEIYTIEFDGEADRSESDLNFGNAQTVQPQAKLVITSTPQDPCSNTPVVVTVSCENLQGDLCGSIASMTLYYDSSSVEMTKGSNGKWTATVPGQSAGTTLSAYAVPKDSQGNFIGSIGTTATVEITWVNCAIDIEKTADRQTVEPGDTITYTLTVKNTGSATINDATVVDTLPPGTLYKSAYPLPSGVSGSVVTWNLGELEGGASVVIKLNATVESDVCTRQSFTPSDEQNQKRVATSATQPSTQEERLTIMAASPVDQELIDSLYRNMTRLEAKLNYVRKYRDTFDKANASLVISNVTLNGSVYRLMNYTNTTTGDVLTEAYNSSGALAWSLLVRPHKYDSLRTEYVNGRVASENYVTREPWEGLLVEYDKPYPGYTNLTVTYYPTGDTLVVVRDLYGNVISKEYKKLPGVPPVPLELENCATVTGMIGDTEVSDRSCATVTVICPVPPQGKLTLAKRPSVEVASVGQTITYTYTITNGGGTTISNIYVEDDMLGRINTDPITLGPGDTAEITATYVVKATDESPIKNVAIAKGEDPNGDVVSDPAEAEVVIAGEVLFNKTAEPKVVEPGDTITYTIRYQNTGGALHDVYIVDHYPNEVYFISATPAPTSGNNVWYIGDLASGESGEIVILVGVAQELGNMSFRMDQSVSGSGYVNVYNNLCTTPPKIVNRAEMVYRLTENGESTKATAAAEVQLGPPATCAKIKEHGSGSYETDDLVRYERGNRTITWNKSLSATHYPTSFSLPRNRSLNYTTLWVEKQKAKNYATDASFSEEYAYARDIKRDSSLQMDENGSRLMIDTEFTGMGHVGILKARESNMTKNAMYWGGAVYESREDYVGSFRLYQKVDEYGEHLRSESEASGTGFAAVDKRLGSAQRSYESGTGIYESSQLMDTLSSSMHKEISLTHAPANYTYSQGMAANYTSKWYEGMWSKTDKSLISESFSSLDRMKKETYARGLNEMETEAEFSGKADFRVLYQNLSGKSGRTVDLVDQYIGDYRVNRKVAITGVSRYSYPHISVRKEGSVDLANSTYADYRIIVENDGNVNLGPVYILDIFPPGTEYVGSSARPGELTSEYANWTLLNLGIGDTATISLTLNITEEVSNLVNRVIVSGAHDDEWVTARNFSSIRIDWLECCPAELIATKTATVYNDTVSYRISLRNRANYTMVAFVIDYIPSDMQLINYSLTPSQIRENRIEWAVLDLRPGKRIDIDYNMRALRSGTFTNRARVEAYPIDGPGSVEADLAARAYVGVEIREPEREGWTVPKCMGLNCTESYRDDWMSCSTCAPA